MEIDRSDETMNLRIMDARERSKKIVKVFGEFAVGGWVNQDGPGGNPLQKRVNTAISQAEPIQTIMFWGAGDKNSMTSTDWQLLNKLFTLHEKLSVLHEKGCILNVIKADLHIAQNGHGRISDTDVQLENAPKVYLREITQRLEEQNTSYSTRETQIAIRVLTLSDLYKKHGLPFLIGTVGNKDLTITSRYIDFLRSNAQKHNKTEKTPDEAAILYVTRRRKEQLILKESAPNAILLATGVRTGAREIILPEGMPGVFLKTPAPWFKQD